MAFEKYSKYLDTNWKSVFDLNSEPYSPWLCERAAANTDHPSEILCSRFSWVFLLWSKASKGQICACARFSMDSCTQLLQCSYLMPLTSHSSTFTWVSFSSSQRGKCLTTLSAHQVQVLDAYKQSCDQNCTHTHLNSIIQVISPQPMNDASCCQQSMWSDRQTLLWAGISIQDGNVIKCYWHLNHISLMPRLGETSETALSPNFM